jgi:hypothetical protein
MNGEHRSFNKHFGVVVWVIMAAAVVSACGSSNTQAVPPSTLITTSRPTSLVTPGTALPTARRVTPTAPGAATITPAPPPGATSGQTSFTDPFAYCSAVGTIDTPDARYAGPKVPDAVVKGLQKVLNLPGTPAPPLTQGSFWRCMDGKVFACTVGANLPCTEKANTDQVPTSAMNDFCQSNPTADVVPAAVTGHTTIYEWRCANGTPTIVKQVATVDARGFLANIWYEISPNDP